MAVAFWPPSSMKITMGAEFQRSFVYLFCLPVEFMVLCQIVANRVFIVFLMVTVIVAIIMTGFRLAKIVDRHKKNAALICIS